MKDTNWETNLIWFNFVSNRKLRFPKRSIKLKKPKDQIMKTFGFFREKKIEFDLVSQKNYHRSFLKDQMIHLQIENTKNLKIKKKLKHFSANKKSRK